jgi:type II secretory pathway predicted ATPase ExeA
MLTDAMEHFGLTRSLRQVGYFPTDHHEQLSKELHAAIYEGGLIALTGVVGTGKTQLLWRLQGALKSEGKIQVIQLLAVDKHRVTLDTLKLAIYYGLATCSDSPS